MESPFSTPARIHAIDDRAGNVRILTLAPENPFPWRAGQYVHVDAAPYEPRPYSMAAPPRPDGHITLHVRNTGTGLSAHLAAEARTGDILTLDGPFGNLDAQHAQNRPVLMVAGGTGIAPMLALAQDIIRRGITEEGTTLIYGVRGEDDVYCRRELDALLASGEVTLHTVTGPRTPDMELQKLGLNLAHHVIYLSGPDAMMHSVTAALLNHLADPSRIFTDADMMRLQEDVP